MLQSIIRSGHFHIDTVYGTSIGAILAPLISVENIDKIVGIFNNINTIYDVVQRRSFCGIPYPNWQIVMALTSFLQMGVYEKIGIVDTMLSKMTTAEITLAKTKCHVVAFDILNNKEQWFTGNELEKGIECSSALWLAVPPISYNNTLFSDGGVTEVFPVTYILDHDNNVPFDGVYIFIDCDSRETYTNPVPSDGLTLMSMLQWSATTRLADYELQKLQTTLNDKLYMIRPTKNILSGALDINPERMKATFDAGVIAGNTFVSKFV